jgi:hypothetical protein
MISGLQTQYDRLQHRIDQAYTDKLDGKIPEDLFLRKINDKLTTIAPPLSSSWVITEGDHRGRSYAKLVANEHVRHNQVCQARTTSAAA